MGFLSGLVSSLNNLIRGKDTSAEKIFAPTGQPLSEVLAIRKRAETETPADRIKRLGADKVVKEKWTSINCPLCDVAISYESGELTDLEPYPYHDNLKLYGQGDCPFCKTKISFTYKEGGDLRARDTNWDKVKSKFYRDEEKINDEITQLEDVDDEDDINKSNKLTKKIMQLEAKRQTLGDRFEEREIAYSERQDRYREKALYKFDLEL